MPAALVANTTSVAGVASAGINTTGATFLVAACGSQSPTAAPTDSKGNTWSLLTNRTGSASAGSRIFYVANPTVGTGHTFTSGGSFCAACFAAFSGVQTSSPFDVENGANSQNSAASTGSVSPNQASSLIIAGIGVASGATYSINASFSITNSVAGVGGVNYGAAMAYLVQTSASAVNPAWTFAGGQSAAVEIAVFKAVAGGSSVPVKMAAYRRRWGN